MRKALLLVVCLAAWASPVIGGEFLLNEETARALRIIFSEPVTITGFGDVFTVVEPASESKEFVFSGAKLDPWMGHWVDWSPTTAAIEAVEWLSSPPPSSESASTKPDEDSPHRESGAQVLPPYWGDDTLYRGVNVTLETMREGDIATLAQEWNVNLVRIMLNVQYKGYFMLPSGNLECCAPSDLERLDQLIDICEKYGIRVVVCLTSIADYRFDTHVNPEGDLNPSFWTDPDSQNAWLGFWRVVAARYATRGDVIYGYDILNEPHGVSAGVWNRLAKECTDTIREVDPYHTIIVESVDYAAGVRFEDLEPTGDDNTIYSFHMYEPGHFTHQGWRHRHEEGVVNYPLEGWGKEQLRERMLPVIEFRRQHGVRVYMGETGAICYAPPDSRESYLRDVLELCEEYGFDYTYWDYRGWTHMSLEHSSHQASWGIIADYVGETPSLALVKGYFARNDRQSEAPLLDKPKCLFDRAHWSTYWHDQNVLCLDIAWRLSGPCDVTYHDSGEIMQNDLEGVDLLALGNPYGGRYSTREVAAITEFVNAGGALLFYANYIIPTHYVNALLTEFGIRYDSAIVCSRAPNPILGGSGREEPPFYLVESFNQDHPVGQGSITYMVGWGASFDVSAPAVVIAETGPETWRDVNGNHVQDASEATSSFGFIAVCEYGEGRVAAVADDMLTEPVNWQVVGEMVDWLLEGSI